MSVAEASGKTLVDSNCASVEPAVRDRARGLRRGAGPGSPKQVSEAPSPDLAIGAFSDHGPWIVDPEHMPWRAGVDALRARAQAEVPALVRKRAVPPLVRFTEASALLGASLLGWQLRERRAGGATSRAGLSRRLRRAFERLGPAYIKLGQIVSSGQGLFPPELVEEFKRCRDQVPAEPFAVVRRVVEEDLGAPLERIFTTLRRASARRGVDRAGARRAAASAAKTSS